jgi:predicted nucleic acid-binding protein
LTAILVDTDVLIEVLRERDASVLAEWRRLAMDDQPILYSPVTATELWHGTRKKEETMIRTLLSTMICVPIDEEIGRRAGEFLRTFRASHGVELADALIGATAALHGCMLWTRNRKHYPMKEVGLY